MKMVPLALIAILVPIALTSCSSSRSIEEQTKLVEYEKCLSLASDSVLASRKRLQELTQSLSFEEKLKQAFILEKEFGQFFEKNLLERCSVYRP